MDATRASGLITYLKHITPTLRTSPCGGQGEEPLARLEGWVAFFCLVASEIGLDCPRLDGDRDELEWLAALRALAVLRPGLAKSA